MQLKTLTWEISEFQDRRSCSSTNNGSISVNNQWSRDGVFVGGRQTMQPAQHGLFGLCCADAWSANNFLFSWSNQIYLCFKRVYQASKKSVFPQISQIVDWSDGYCASLPTLVKLSFFCFAPWVTIFQSAWCMCEQLTRSGLRPIRMERTLEKKLARRGLRGGSFWRKPYSFISNFSSSPSRSLIWLMSEVRSSHDMLEYLEERNSSSSQSAALLKLAHVWKSKLSNETKRNQWHVPVRRIDPYGAIKRWQQKGEIQC